VGAAFGGSGPVQHAALQRGQDGRAVGQPIGVYEHTQPCRQVRKRLESCLGQLAGRCEWHERPCRGGEVGQWLDGLGGVPVDASSAITAGTARPTPPRQLNQDPAAQIHSMIT